METRKAKLTVAKSGGTASKSGVTFRATLPSVWIKEMGLSETERNLKLSFDGVKIIIEKDNEEKD